MSIARLTCITTLAIIAFAGNSLLCRIALAEKNIDPASFTSIRILSGTAILIALLTLRQKPFSLKGNWPSALALLTYAAAFSFAYTHLTAATGALILFGSVQATMIGYGLWSGERLNRPQILGITIAISGLLALLLPGLQTPPLASALLMLSSGIAWGIYSLRGRNLGDPTSDTAGNFARATPIALALSLIFIPQAHLTPSGTAYAIASGALASGLGYALWYLALPHLRAATAATAQLCVPALAAIGGVAFLSESISTKLALTSIAILGGVAIFMTAKPQNPPPP